MDPTHRLQSAPVSDTRNGLQQGSEAVGKGGVHKLQCQITLNMVSKMLAAVPKQATACVSIAFGDHCWWVSDCLMVVEFATEVSVF